MEKKLRLRIARDAQLSEQYLNSGHESQLAKAYVNLNEAFVKIPIGYFAASEVRLEEANKNIANCFIESFSLVARVFDVAEHRAIGILSEQKTEHQKQAIRQRMLAYYEKTYKNLVHHFLMQTNIQLTDSTLPAVDRNNLFLTKNKYISPENIRKWFIGIFAIFYLKQLQVYDESLIDITKILEKK